MAWYSVSLMFESIHNPPDAERLWEESIILVDASSEKEAIAHAESIAKEREIKFTTSDGGSSKWQFHCVERACEILDSPIEPGTELFSRFLRASEAESILKPLGDEEDG